MNSLTGKRIRWKFVDDPMGDTTYEHSFNEDGSITWRIIEGKYAGATATEKSYAAVKVNDKTWVVSYLAASGHTLTVVLNKDDGKAIGFGPNDKSWTPLTGTLNFVN